MSKQIKSNVQKQHMFHFPEYDIKEYLKLDDLVSVGEIGWLEGLNVERTEIVLNKISKILHDWIEEGHIKKKTIYGIEVLNEPWGRKT